MDSDSTRHSSHQGSGATTAIGARPGSTGDFGAAVLTVVFSLLLLDAAVETFLSGARVRWWVAGVTAAYFALAILFWRSRPSLRNRVSWSARASATFFVVLGLLAFTSWLPGGLTEGLVILRQPTSVVLSAVTAIAVGFAGFVLVRASGFLPWWGRFALGLVAAYGVTAFVLGIIEGTPYPNLMHGESLWPRLPNLLQGAFTGALVTVPLGLLAEALDALRRMRLAENCRYGLQQSVALALCVVMAVSGLTVSTGSGVKVSASSIGAQLSAEEITQPLYAAYQKLGAILTSNEGREPSSPELIARQLEALFPALESTAREIPRDTFDLEAVLQRVGRDPLKLFEWVRDETALVPYRGLLRGETGVLMDRIGNSLDRAMLLYRLLRSSGVQARMARGLLSQAQANELLAEARANPWRQMSANQQHSSKAAIEALENFAQESQTDITTIRRRFDTLAREHQRMVDLVKERVAIQVSAISAAVGKPTMGTSRAAEPTMLEAIRDHWWVQWHDGRSWFDLDPALPKIRPGSALTQGSQTMEPGKSSDIAEELRHSIRVRIIVEQWQREQLREQEVLAHVFHPSELYGIRIALTHYPMQWPRDLNLMQDNNPGARLKTTVLAQREWLPVLSVGSEQVIKASFTASGEVNQTPLAPLLGSSSQQLGRRVGDWLSGGRIGQAPGREAQAESHLTAEWIEYEIHSPGRPSRRIRRQVFDLLGPEARSRRLVAEPTLAELARLDRGLALLETTEMLPLASRLSSEFVHDLILSNLLANKEGLLRFLRVPSDRLADSQVLDQTPRLRPISTELYALALARWRWLSSERDVYLDRPNLMTYRTQYRQDTQGRLLRSRGFDIVANEVAVRPGTQADPFLVRLEQGVLDTNAEALLVDGFPKQANAAELFASTRGADWLVVRTPHEPLWVNAKFSQDHRARVALDVAAGYSILVSQQTHLQGGRSVTCWWRIDPRTGDALGIGSDGNGQSSVEAAIVISVGTTLLTSLTCNVVMSMDGCQSYKDMIVCSALALGAGLGVLGGILWGGMLITDASVTVALVSGVVAGVGAGASDYDPDPPCVGWKARRVF